MKLWIFVNMKRYFMSVMFIPLQFYFCNYIFISTEFSFNWLFFIKLSWWNRTHPIFSKSDQTDLIKQKHQTWNDEEVFVVAMEKNDKKWTHAIHTTMLPTPKFWPTPPTPSFQPMPKFYGPMPPTPNFQPRRHMPFFDPRQNFTDPTHPCQSLTPANHRPTLRTPLMLFSDSKLFWVYHQKTWNSGWQFSNKNICK